MATSFVSKGRRLLGLNLQAWIRGFFGSAAGLSFGIIFLIFLFLLFEAVRFFPAHHAELQLAQKTGQEYVDHLIRESDEYQELVSLTNQAYFQELDARFGKERGVVDSFEVLLDVINDTLEDEISEVSAARAAGDEQKISAAEASYQQALVRVVQGADREMVDSFGRLDQHEEAWQALLTAAQTYDAVADEVPLYVSEAERRMVDGMAQFRAAKDLISEAGVPLRDLRNRLVEIASASRKEVLAARSASARKEALLEGARELGSEAGAEMRAEAEAISEAGAFPFGERAVPIREAQPAHREAAAFLEKTLTAGLAQFPSELTSPAAAERVAQIRRAAPRFQKALAESVREAGTWRWDQPVPLSASVTEFFLGQQWRAASDWRQLYGFLPLFTGSFLIALIALAVAVPFSIGAAIYVNQLSSPWEQTLLKPIIEMIQAIPSIVLGFFGIMILGDLLRTTSASPLLAWLPGFPITERLNMLNAGLLLALMAVPTIFTLCEDALNHVPRSFSEASLALGASKFETIRRVVVPAALSGISAAVLLGFGRVIGETMVVLLVAGNKIAMPDWSAGLGVLTQPAHTMTGIIAQEMDEVSVGTLHYRALFLIGLVLFLISLVINVAAQGLVKRFHHA